MFARTATNVVIVDLNTRDCCTPENVATSFKAAKGNKVDIGVNFHVLKNDYGVKIVMQLRCEDESEVE